MLIFGGVDVFKATASFGQLFQRAFQGHEPRTSIGSWIRPELPGENRDMTPRYKLIIFRKKQVHLGEMKIEWILNSGTMYQLRYQLQIFMAGKVLGRFWANLNFFGRFSYPQVQPIDQFVCEESTKFPPRGQIGTRDLPEMWRWFQEYSNPEKICCINWAKHPGPLAVEFVKVYRGPFIKMNRLLFHC